ncbi:guanylate cyclase [Plakobranchus ocellatus]|uniref:Guanylate cyclase n=1 Tax=Plakobranchus ocellatus TaxID=259542 RepID=A0AAV4DF93_9GAST|nr:guanylate cyclase [Plakobranchus ocellatus]
MASQAKMRLRPVEITRVLGRVMALAVLSSVSSARTWRPAVVVFTLLLLPLLHGTSAQRATPASRTASSAARVVGSASACKFDDVRRRRDNVIRMGVILPSSLNEYGVSLRRTIPAFELAREYIYERDDLLFNYTIEFDFKDSNSSEVNGPLAGIEMYAKKEADVFFGPSSNYAVAPLARYASVWGIPIITAGGLVQALGDKSGMYRLLTRMMSDYDKVGEFFLTILERFEYHNVGMMMHADPNPGSGQSVQEFTLEATFNLIKNAWNPNITIDYVKPFNAKAYNQAELEGLLRSLSKLCRGEHFPFSHTIIDGLSE